MMSLIIFVTVDRTHQLCYVMIKLWNYRILPSYVFVMLPPLPYFFMQESTIVFSFILSTIVRLLSKCGSGGASLGNFKGILADHIYHGFTYIKSFLHHWLGDMWQGCTTRFPYTLTPPQKHT